MHIKKVHSVRLANVISLQSSQTGELLALLHRYRNPPGDHLMNHHCQQLPLLSEEDLQKKDSHYQHDLSQCSNLNSDSISLSIIKVKCNYFGSGPSVYSENWNTGSEINLFVKVSLLETKQKVSHQFIKFGCQNLKHNIHTCKQIYECVICSDHCTCIVVVMGSNPIEASD